MMNDPLSALVNPLDMKNISRRQLLRALGFAAVSAPMAAFGQGRCGGARAGTPECDTKPLPLPFESTGWKTVLLDHFSMQVAEVEKEAAFYNALMGWKVRSADGNHVVMDIGNWGSAIIRGGFQAPPTPPAPVTPSAGADAARGGRGGGAPRVPRRALWDNFCWGIEPWDTKKVESELRKRGLTPVADHNAKENFFSFHVKDPDGFDLQISNGNKKNRRTTPANAKLSVPAPFEATGWQTIYLDHISFEVTNYKESVAFYQALLGWIPTGDEGSQNDTTIAPEIGRVLIRRGGNPATPATGRPRSAQMGHVAFDVADFDPDKVKDALLKRGLTAREDTGATDDSPAFEKDIHTSTHKSYHTTTPNGYDLQVSYKSKT